MDDLDVTLIELFAAEPRIGVLEASRRLGVARGTVQARLDKLTVSGVITGWGPDLSPEALGYPVTAFLTLEIRQGSGHRAIAWCRRTSARTRHSRTRSEPFENAPGDRLLQTTECADELAPMRAVVMRSRVAGNSAPPKRPLRS